MSQPVDGAAIGPTDPRDSECRLLIQWRSGVDFLQVGVEAFRAGEVVGSHDVYEELAQLINKVRLLLMFVPIKQGHADASRIKRC